MTLRNLLPTISQHPRYSLMEMQDKLSDLVEHLFTDNPMTPGTSLMRAVPPMDVVETEDMVIVKAELPSMDKDDIKIDVNKNRIVISGEKRVEKEDDKASYRLCEISYGRFSRSMVLGFEIDPSKVTASFAKGTLAIKIKKPEKEMASSHSVSITSD